MKALLPNVSFRSRMVQSLALYALFLIPTALLLVYAGFQDATLSRTMGGTWQGTVWQFPFLGEVGSRVFLDALETLAIVALGGLYYQGYQLLQQSISGNDSPCRAILTWVTIGSALLILTTPFHSSDIFGYLNRGFQQSGFHTNPYLTPIADIPNWRQSPLLHDHWIDNPCPYGFFFAQLAKWLTEWASPSFTKAFLLFKLLNALLVIGTTCLIAQVNQAAKGKRPWLSAFLFGASPLVLLHAVGNGHNDILMVFLLLSALWTIEKPALRWLSLPLLTLSILTKYAPLLAAPFIVVYLWKNRHWKPLLGGILLSLAITFWLGSTYVDFSQPWPWNALLDNAGKPQHSILSMLTESLYYPLKWFHLPAKAMTQQVSSVLKPLFWVSFIGFFSYQLLQFTRNAATFQQLLNEITLVTVVMVALISAKFHPWYPIMFLPLALTLPESSKVRQFSLILSLFQLAGFTILQNLPVFSQCLLTLVPLWLTIKQSKRFQAQPASP